MCPQLGFSFGIYLKHLLCGKFPPISKGHITVTARGRGAGGTPLPAGFCHWNCRDHSCPRSALAFLLFTSHREPRRSCQGSEPRPLPSPEPSQPLPSENMQSCIPTENVWELQKAEGRLRALVQLVSLVVPA